MSSNQSYQLPDLLGIISSLELRTNRHCRFATDASEAWLHDEGASASGVSARGASAAEPRNSEGSSIPLAHQEPKPNGILTPAELSYLRSTKLGLLCALCFPTCDAPQLRILTDFVSLLFYYILRERDSSLASIRGSSVSLNSPESPQGVDTIPPSQHQFAYNPPVTAGNLDNDETKLAPSSGFDLLQKRGLLRHIVDRRLLDLESSSSTSESWKTRFHSSVSSFLSAQSHVQLQLQSYHNQNSTKKTRTTGVPTLEEYIPIARELYGAKVVLELAELLEVFKVPDFHRQVINNNKNEEGGLTNKITNLIEQLRDAALDVIAWSMDVVSYQHTYNLGTSNPTPTLNPNPNPYNLISILTHHNNLSIQGAMSLSGLMIKQAFSTFCATERELVESLDRLLLLVHVADGESRRGYGWSAWMWKTLGLASSSSSPPSDPCPSASSTQTQTHTDIQTTKRYIQALKDTIVGVLHWVYETELFFGAKGGEIRAFGWVFVGDHDHDHGSSANGGEA